MNTPLSPCVPENFVSRDGFSRPVPRQPAHFQTRLNLVLTYGISPEFRGGVLMSYFRRDDEALLAAALAGFT